METMYVEEPWLTHIYDSEKTVEGRMYAGKWTKLALGDRIEVKSRSSELSFAVVVGRLTVYHSLEDFLENEILESVLPGVNTIEEAIDVYHQYYPPQTLKDHDFVAIEIRRV